jgi:bacterioferritin
MAKTQNTRAGREELIAGLNEDLAREYQAIIAYVVYSQVLKGAEFMAIAKELEVLGGKPTVTSKPVAPPKDEKQMLRADLDNETETIRQYRLRVRQAEACDEVAVAEDIREILRQEQEHQIDLATALGIEVPRT